METAICGRVTLSPNHVFNPKPDGIVCRKVSWLILMIGIERTWKSRKTAPPYRVLLHNDNFNKREYVVQVLMKVIPGMTLDNAVNIMQEAHYNGLAVVIICAQADAEEHCMQLRGNGLLSSIEPASGEC
ncbi:PREDICTED: ATP-dependent Clp protease adapter protein CLPS1, chloroplastic isoform X2 [Nelumbo nucifera]|uniref:ATP-dependent Clp protease adapter protein CLPS1, chloroplastic isoform X2 n=1 Tax=Nelumbo nucifera TaxID=4432 RepID=A0A1U8Q864_NELNU|nr:PREDICTED: ATP-dependent Clp protease adapter protein CLPS1, chloroplastic isoform X2 [Nelumbo nucifera]